MHIADGILPAGISVAADALAIALVYAGGRNLESKEIPRMGIFAAALFIVSLIHFPLAGTSIHLGLYGFAGMLFGIRAIPIIFVNLLFQSLIFQHGGLVSIGINTLTMGSGALLSAVIWQWVKIPRGAGGLNAEALPEDASTIYSHGNHEKYINKNSLKHQVKSFVCGFLGILVPAVLISLIFILSDYGKGMIFMISIYFPAAVIEGVLTLFIYNFFMKAKPEIFK